MDECIAKEMEPETVNEGKKRSADSADVRICKSMDLRDSESNE